MRSWRSPSSSSPISTYERFQKLYCTNRYVIYKKEIEERINNFNNRRYAPFKKHWDTINNYIREKNDEITPCVNKKYIRVDFYADESIKYFSERCRNASTCRHNPASSVKKPRASQTETKTACKGGIECNKQLSSTQTANSKSQLSVTHEDPKARSPKVHVSPEKVQKHANLQESQQEIKNVEAKQDIKPSGNSVGSEHETTEPKVNSNTSPYGESEDKAQFLPVLANPANNELVTGLNDSASQTTPEGESDLSDTTEVTNLPINTIQSGPNSVQVVDNETAAIHSNGHLNLDYKFSCPGDSTTEGIGTVPDEKATLDGSAHSEKVDNGGITASSLLSEGNNGHRAEHSPTPKEDVPVMGSQVQVPNITTSCRGGDTFVENDNGSPCSAENDTELVTDNGNKSDFFGKIFEVISNKDHIIQASAPMGIVMLLGLLFKFTPLWRVLTKKNMNKRAGINQELHSVLQEPSIMDEERSIPFSYSAFEYSS
ncbi:hypothetical protein PVMG_06111 [Plasmodium vivax Mauritania I]|uniref:Variable surface protein Vir18 n=1 Tax=Plasmodium vivax Mauritania I TaxID=1035515 RepID=A0A0J9TH52_PLAVI|nr:hypothetical protein PVMG_06111 [Plasmodium vivax Mauritania I]